MKRLWLLIYLSISVEAVELSFVNLSLEEVLDQKSNDFVGISIAKPMLYVQKETSSKLSFTFDGHCIERFGESFYDAKAGISYFFTSLLGFETGYQLVPTKMNTIEDINSKYIGIYGSFVLKF